MIKGLVSILMPVKNAAPYLKDCVLSIQNQDYTDWELIAVNDHSSDDSLEILQSFAAIDSRIKIFQNIGHGIIHALQLAYLNCKGQFISRMDADDIMTIHRVSTLVDSLKKYGEKHLAIGQVKYFSDTGLGDGYKKYESWLNGLTKMGHNWKDLYKECVIPSPCWMVYRTDFEKCGKFNGDIYPEDYDLCFRFYQYGLTCIPCDEVLHHWRDYSIRSSRTSEHYADNRFLAIKCKYFLALNYDASRPLIIWGAGKKGKTLAQKFKAKNITFQWACNNENKIGKDIYGTTLIDSTELNYSLHPQIIVTVANSEEQQLIQNEFNHIGLASMVDYFFFC